MAVRYKTIVQAAEAELIIEKSKFFGFIRPVSTPEEAEMFVASIKRTHRDATHNVPVYVIGEKFEIQKYSDDGEPTGTAGVPVLQMLIKEGITNVVVVMTRYFGGVKLGTGGLVRAYTGIAKAALKEAGIAEVKDMDVLTIRISYTYLGKIENLALKGQFFIRDTVFDEGVSLTITVPPEVVDVIKNVFTEITSGTCQFLSQGRELELVPLS